MGNKKKKTFTYLKHKFLFIILSIFISKVATVTTSKQITTIPKPMITLLQATTIPKPMITLLQTKTTEEIMQMLYKLFILEKKLKFLSFFLSLF